MAYSRSQIIAALDVGSSKVACVVAQPLDDGYRVLGAGTRRAQGLRQGVVTEMDAAEAAIRAAVDTAEKMAGITIEDIFVSLSGGLPSSQYVTVEMAAPDRPIDDLDVRRLLQQAGARADAGERAVLHAIPMNFTLDGASGIRDPRGMAGCRLGVDVHVVSAAAGAQRNLEMCVERCMLRPADLIAATYAAGLGCLSWDDRDLGSAVVDLGAGVTKIGIFREGALIHADTIPMGGAHITNDIARILATTIEAAERLKTTRGGVYVGPADDDEMVPVPGLGESWSEGAGRMPLSLLIGIIRPRVEEILETVRERIDSSGHAAIAGRKVVLTGGGSLLTGLDRMAHDILDMPVRIGRPVSLSGLPDAMSGPAYTTLAGAVAFAERRLEARAEATASPGSGAMRAGRFARLGRWLKENF